MEEHEHEWSTWKTTHYSFRRRGEPIREGRYCFLCDATQLRPKKEK
jgi:hypothetical protein